MSAYFNKVLRKMHQDLKQELKDKGIEIPRRGRKEVERVNRELKRELLDGTKSQ